MISSLLRTKQKNQKLNSELNTSQTIQLTRAIHKRPFDTKWIFGQFIELFERKKTYRRSTQITDNHLGTRNEIVENAQLLI